MEIADQMRILIQTFPHNAVVTPVFEFGLAAFVLNMSSVFIF